MFGLALFIVVGLMSCVSAAENTTLIVHGQPFHYQVVRVLDPLSQAVIMSLYPGENYTGVTSKQFKTTRSQVTFLVIDKYDKKTVKVYDDFETYPTGGIIELWLDNALRNEGDVVEEVVEVNDTEEEGNETEVDNESIVSEDEEVVNETEQSNGNSTLSTVTGKITDLASGLNSPYIYYTLGGLVIVGIALFFGVRGIKKLKQNRVGVASSDKIKDSIKKIRESERKIEEMQDEINELKGIEIKRAEEKLADLKDEKEELVKQQQEKQEASKEESKEEDEPSFS